MLRVFVENIDRLPDNVFGAAGQSVLYRFESIQGCGIDIVDRERPQIA